MEWPSVCLQENQFENISNYRHFNMNEDCLYLNVWSPKVDVNDERELRPVLVYIHGGGLIVGSSVLKYLEGSKLSTMADAVIVTINYRLSIFGLLYSDEVEHIKGNMAFWDQALALEWVQQNIRYFGGNPEQVTIAGCRCATDSDHTIGQKMIDCLNQMNVNELIKVMDSNSLIFNGK
ncbi:hypothetical protein BLA29_008459 [Euroglyphus maynei]|uniref:Carboxylesterase type B domain-containing protein n=1 Tax=Euroglyphus maynei TaxID=6958 RepID=A0A1Y3BPX4_EURMA|nr:hypothetical protein BLA29_008459 [Euroglyphus maynei]